MDLFSNEEFILNLLKCVECSICLNTLKAPVVLPCSHTYCKDCILTAIKICDKCPVCSTKVTKSCLTSCPVLSNLEGILNLALALAPNVATSHKRSSSSAASSSSATMAASSAPSHTINKLMSAHPSSSSSSTTSSSSSSSSSSSTTTTTSTSSTSSKKSPQRFRPGDVVSILPRTWPGMNKPGGAAFIVSAHVDDNSYDVKYVLDKTNDLRVPAAFVVESAPVETRRRRSREASDDAMIVKGCEESKDFPLSKCGRESPQVGGTKKKKSRTPHTEDNDMYSLFDASLQGHQNNQCMVLLSTALDVESSLPLEEFSARFNGQVSHLFDDNVTHLVVSVKDGVMMQRTMKYMQAIMAGLWIVSDNWIFDSLKANRVLAERNYEIIKNIKASIDEAPRRARESIAKTTIPPSSLSGQAKFACKNKLFSGYRVHLFGSFPHPGPKHSHLSELLESGSGNVVTSLDEFLLASPRSPCRYRVIVVADITAKEEVLQAIGKITADIKKTCGDIYFVGIAWILDSVGNFKVGPLSDYHI